MNTKGWRTARRPTKGQGQPRPRRTRRATRRMQQDHVSVVRMPGRGRGGYKTSQNASTNAPSEGSRRTYLRRLEAAQTTREAVSTHQESLAVFRDAPNAMERATTARRTHQSPLLSPDRARSPVDPLGEQETREAVSKPGGGTATNDVRGCQEGPANDQNQCMKTRNAPDEGIL